MYKAFYLEVNILRKMLHKYLKIVLQAYKLCILVAQMQRQTQQQYYLIIDLQTIYVVILHKVLNARGDYLLIQLMHTKG